MRIAQALIVVIRPDLGREEIQQEFGGQRADLLVELIGEILLKAGDDGRLLFLRKSDLLHLRLPLSTASALPLQRNQLIHQGNSIAGFVCTAYCSGH